MKLFAVTANGRKGEWFDDCPQFVLGAASAYTLPHYPDYTVHLTASLYDEQDLQPDHFGEDAIIFCSGKVGQQWKWHMLLGEEGVQRGLLQGWLHHPSIPRTPLVHVENTCEIASKPSWFQKFLGLFR